MKILYMGLMFCEKSLENEYKNTKCGVAMAPHKFQSNFIQGIEQQEDVELSVINIPPTGSFPFNNKEIFSKKYNWGSDYNQIGYINLPIIKHFWQKKGLYKEVKRILCNNWDGYIIAYSLYEPFLSVIEKIKKENPQIKVILIQTDAVPGRNDMEKYMTKRAISKGNRMIKLSRFCDGFIILSKYLAEPLEIGKRPYYILECIADGKQQINKISYNKKNICLYTGSVNKEFGICELSEAISRMENAELWICGSGDATDYVKKISEKAKNIKYFGYVNQKRIRELQNESSFLVNPRRPTGTYTKYSFPSKTVEYMMTGKPVIMYKLEAIPDEYDEYLNYISEDTCEGIIKELDIIFSQDYEILLQKAKRAHHFVLNNKNPIIIGKKIITFLKENIKEEKMNDNK